MRMTHNAINQSERCFGADILREGAAGALFLGGLRCHKMPHNPNRLRLLLVMLKLLAICDTCIASSSFFSRFPANPLPACKSSIKVFSTAVEDSMFFIAVARSVVLVLNTPLNSRANWLVSSEKKTRLLTARATEGLLCSTSELRLSTVFKACS